MISRKMPVSEPGEDSLVWSFILEQRVEYSSWECLDWKVREQNPPIQPETAVTNIYTEDSTTRRYAEI